MHLLHVAFVTVLLTTISGFSNPSRKTWWSKRIATDSYHTAGRLSLRQLKYAHDAGFRSIVSLFTYESQVGDSDAYGGSYLPTTAVAKETIENYTDVTFAAVLNSGGPDGWKTDDTIRRFHGIARNSPKPILFHCTDSYAATFVLLAYFANVTAHGDNGDGEPQNTGSQVFTIGAELGYDYGKDDVLKNLVSEITGSVISNVPSPGLVVPDWYKHYWLMKPMSRNWFFSGQIQADHLADIRAAGVKSVLNSRRGLTIPPNTQSQEEVTLLNIRDRTGTYTGTGRQTDQVLVSNRLRISISTRYISPTSSVNYESRNTLEFGDDIGYNEATENTLIKQYGFSYTHLPIGGKYGYSVDMWNAYKDSIKSADDVGVVLLHCRTGFRSGVLAVLATAYINCFSSKWATNKALQLGYQYSTSSPAAIQLFQDVLDNRNDIQECIRNRDRTQTTTTTPSSGNKLRGVSVVIATAAMVLQLFSI